MVAFLDRSPATPGPTLVVPRAHAADLWDISEAEAREVMGGAHEVAAMLLSALAPDGLTLHQANRPAGGQDVFHFHLHVIPRYVGDEVRPSWSASPADPLGLQAVARRIRGESHH